MKKTLIRAAVFTMTAVGTITGAATNALADTPSSALAQQLPTVHYGDRVPPRFPGTLKPGEYADGPTMELYNYLQRIYPYDGDKDAIRAESNEGRYGPAMTAAVQDFQRRAHVGDGSGVINQDTWKALYLAVSTGAHWCY